jgi:predicted transcriptional regulator
MGLLNFKVLERVDLFLYVTEKEVSTLAFPNLDGRFDYWGFTSKNSRARKWCKDLFSYYWEKVIFLRDPLRVMHVDELR